MDGVSESGNFFNQIRLIAFFSFDAYYYIIWIHVGVIEQKKQDSRFASSINSLNSISSFCIKILLKHSYKVYIRHGCKAAQYSVKILLKWVVHIKRLLVDQFMLIKRYLGNSPLISRPVHYGRCLINKTKHRFHRAKQLRGVIYCRVRLRESTHKLFFLYNSLFANKEYSISTF